VSDQTKAEKITSAFKNNPRGAWITVIASLLLVVAQLVGAVDAIRKFLFVPEPSVEWSVVFSLPWQLQPIQESLKPARDRHTAVIRAIVTNRGSHQATILDTGFVLGEGDSQWDPLRSSRPFDGFTIREGEVKSIEIPIPFELPAAQAVAPRTKTGGIFSENENGMVPIGCAKHRHTRR
jgi:hypothetical protein